MAKKKTEKDSAFDVEKALQELECPNMFKAGLGYYIENRNIEIKDSKDFDKTVKDFSKLSL